MAECSVESFIHKDLQKLIYLNLFTDCFGKISPRSSGLIILFSISPTLCEPISFFFHFVSRTGKFTTVDKYIG